MGDIPLWMLTYADTVTLLMTFFVLLMGFSTVQDENYGRVGGILTGYWSVTATGEADKDSLFPKIDLWNSRVQIVGYENISDYGPLQLTREDLQVRLRASNVSNMLQVHLTRHGLEIQIRPGVVFAEGAAGITPDGRKLLATIGQAIRHLPNQVRIDAQADALFVPTEAYPLVRELSLARAAACCAMLSGEQSVPPERLLAGAPVGEDATNVFRRDPNSPDLTVTVLRQPQGRPNL